MEEQPDQRGDAYTGVDRQPRPEEQERRRGRLSRNLEIASHEGADEEATRWAVRAMLSTMQQRDGPMNQYSVEYMEEALDNRVWHLPLEVGLEPAHQEEVAAIREEVEALQDEIDARVLLQGAYDNVLRVGPNLGDYGDLLIKYYKVVPSAEDFLVLGNLSATPEGVEEVEEEVLGPWEIIETRETDREGNWKTKLRQRRVRRRELVGYRGEVKEGEPTLGFKIDLALRKYVDLSIIKAPVWALKRKVWKNLSEKEIIAKQEQIQKDLHVNDAELKTLSSFGADKPIQEKINATRKFVRESVGDKDAERIACQLYYVLELATKFGLSGKEENPEIVGFPASTDLFNLFHFEERRKAEYAENRPAGPPVTLGCYPDLAVSLMDFIKVDDPEDHGPEEDRRQVSFWTLWYDKGVAFGELPWRTCRRSNIFDFSLVQRWKAHEVHSAALKVTDWDLQGEIMNPNSWRKLNKAIQLAVGMLDLGSELGKKHGEKRTEAVMRAIKYNILGGAVISNMSTHSWFRGTTENPPEAPPGISGWEIALRRDAKDVKDLLKYVIVEKSKFLSWNEWEDWQKKVIGKRRGIKVGEGA